MSVGSSHIETEIKLRAPDPSAAAELLTTHGFTLCKPRTYEKNTLYDTASNDLRSSGRLLRIREAGGNCKLTLKAPATFSGQADRHKIREELEIDVSDAHTLEQIVKHLGYRRTFIYEKYRTEFESDGRGTAVLDETPIGTFLELEGDGKWIDESAQRLGFRESDYVTASYGRLYLDWCAEHGKEPGNMTWPDASPSRS